MKKLKGSPLIIVPGPGRHRVEHKSIHDTSFDRTLHGNLGPNQKSFSIILPHSLFAPQGVLQRIM